MFMREEHDQQPPHPALVGEQPHPEHDDEGEHDGGEDDPLEHHGDEEDPVMALGVEDLLVGSQLLLQVLDAHGPSLAVVSAATYHEGWAA
jgi:hypothetical protein